MPKYQPGERGARSMIMDLAKDSGSSFPVSCWGQIARNFARWAVTMLTRRKALDSD